MLMNRVIIHLDHVTHNVNYIRKQIGPYSLICGVIKANAYGHGLVRIAQHLTSIGVERLAIVNIGDLIALRNAGINVPIHTMSVLHPDERAIAIELDAIPFVHSQEEITSWQEIAKSVNKKIFIHLKINSHMNRLGIDVHEQKYALSVIQQSSHLKLEGIGLHLAQASIPNHTSTVEDVTKIENIKKQLSDSSSIIYHIASSLAIKNYPNSLYDMVRPGIALYGYEFNNQLKPALSWISSIVRIRKVKAGSAVSYNTTYITPKDTYLAVVPIGYADGYPREFTHTSHVLINSQRYKVVGVVCMNQIIIDLGLKHSVNLFDPVYLIHALDLNAHILAQNSNTISYRILTSINQTIPRIYKPLKDI